jgi:hypothetical protein
MNFRKEENSARQLIIEIKMHLPYALQVVCRSISRNGTSFEIFDQDKVSMGTKTFYCNYGPIAYEFNKSLVDDLNVLLEEIKVEIVPAEFQPISKLAVSKCESRYGDGLENGDCIICLK